MFARIFSISLKPGEGPGYARTIDREVIPILRGFAGFRDEIAMVSADGQRAVGISFWDRPEDADRYSRDAYKEVVRALERHIEGTPVIQTYQVTNSTAHAIVALFANA